MAMEGDISRAKAIVLNFESVGNTKVDGEVKNYMANFKEEQGGSVEKRKENYATMVNTFYDLVTNFYEFGWGQSFHFAPRHQWESFETSIARHEMWLAYKLNLQKGQTAIDIGCGVGGPARCIARFTEANVVGLNNNEYQVGRGKTLSQQARMSSQLAFIKGDFMKIPAPDNTYDAAYSIEATCHAPDKVGVYSEIFRVLKPGQLYGTYEWVMTEDYDPSNPEHVRIKKGIEVGNGLPELQTPDVIIDALKQAGFEILEANDRAIQADPETPWYYSLSGSFSFTGFKHTRIGRYISNRAVAALEWLKIAPTGTTAVSNMLLETANDLVEGGKLNIFTPTYFVLARKPLDSN